MSVDEILRRLTRGLPDAQGAIDSVLDELKSRAEALQALHELPVASLEPAIRAQLVTTLENARSECDIAAREASSAVVATVEALSRAAQGRVAVASYEEEAARDVEAPPQVRRIA